MSKTGNIVFFGTPEFAVSSLEAILSSGRDISLVVTQPDRPFGRGKKIKASAVKEFAISRKILVIQPAKMKDPKFHNALLETNSKLFVVASYGRILPSSILEIPEMTLNVHASLLPRWRGASPINHAILKGDCETGISIIKLVEELDAGDVMMQKITPIDSEEDAVQLENRLAKLGGEAIVEGLDNVDAGDVVFTPQNSMKVTYAPLLTSKDGQINWGQTTVEIHNQIRGLQRWPGAYTSNQKQRIKIFRSKLNNSLTTSRPVPGKLCVNEDRLWIACGDDWLELLELQREGKSKQPAASFLSGYKLDDATIWS